MILVDGVVDHLDSSGFAFNRSQNRLVGFSGNTFVVGAAFLRQGIRVLKVSVATGCNGVGVVQRRCGGGQVFIFQRGSLLNFFYVAFEGIR